MESAATKKSADWIYVSEILGNSEDYHSTLSRERASKYRERIEHVRGILNYKIPVIRMIGHSFKEARDAFERINVQGTRLKAANVYASEIATTHKNFIASKFAPFIQEIHSRGFNGINAMHLFKVCEFVAGAGKKSLYALETSELKVAWEKTEKATGKGIKFLDEQFGVKKMDTLRSGALLVVPISLFATLPTSDINKDALAGWLVLASVHHQYSSAAETALDKDLTACKRSDPIRTLLKNIKEKRKLQRLLTTPENFGGQINDRGALFAAYIACRHKGCLGLFTGTKLETYLDVDQHHLFPRSRFSIDVNEHGISKQDSDTIANIAFIKEDANRSLGDEPPSVYLRESSADRLESQCIPQDKRLWEMGNAGKFWEERRILLAEAFNNLVSRKLTDYRL